MSMTCSCQPLQKAVNSCHHVKERTCNKVATATLTSILETSRALWASSAVHEGISFLIIITFCSSVKSCSKKAQGLLERCPLQPYAPKPEAQPGGDQAKHGHVACAEVWVYVEVIGQQLTVALCLCSLPQVEAHADWARCNTGSCYTVRLTLKV